MNGTLIAQILEFVPELAPLVARLGGKPKEQEMVILLLGHLAKSSGEGFAKLDQKLDLLTGIAKYNRALGESQATE